MTPRKTARGQAAATLSKAHWAGVDPKTRSAIMRKVAQARWSKKKGGRT